MLYSLPALLGHDRVAWLQTRGTESVLMQLQNAIQETIREIPDCVAAGYVELSTGALLAVKTLDSHPPEVLELVAVASAELIQGATVTAIEKLFRKTRGVKDDGRHYFQEMLVFSDTLLHVFVRARRNQNHVACFVCRKRANIGMVLTKCRLAMPMLESAM